MYPQAILFTIGAVVASLTTTILFWYIYNYDYACGQKVALGWAISFMASIVLILISIARWYKIIMN